MKKRYIAKLASGLSGSVYDPRKRTQSNLVERTSLMYIRVLNESDARSYKEVRLRALQRDPEAFGSTYEQEVDRPLEMFAERIKCTEDTFTLGCFDENQSLVGIVNFMRENRRKTSHKGNIYGMYVEPNHRSEGIGKALLLALIERATTECVGLEQLYLTVVSNNEPAKRLYASLGFKVYGVEPNALKFQGQYFDEDLMVLQLK